MEQQEQQEPQEEREQHEEPRCVYCNNIPLWSSWDNMMGKPPERRINDNHVECSGCGDSWCDDCVLDGGYLSKGDGFLPGSLGRELGENARSDSDGDGYAEQPCRHSVGVYWRRPPSGGKCGEVFAILCPDCCHCEECDRFMLSPFDVCVSTVCDGWHESRLCVDCLEQSQVQQCQQCLLHWCAQCEMDGQHQHEV
jgi:hypothetical protein